MTAELAAAAALAVGYALGRARPWRRLGEWAAQQVATRPHRWVGRGKTREAVLFAAVAVTNPRAAWWGWKHRHATEGTRPNARH